MHDDIQCEHKTNAKKVGMLMRIKAVNLSNMVLDELMHLTFLKIIADEEVI